MISNKPRVVLLFSLAALGLMLPAGAARVGVKCNRSKLEYPNAVLSDLKRMHSDRIDTLMICLPWRQWEPEEGRLDQEFVSKGLAPVLEFCAKNGMSVLISNHCSLWGAKGNWSLPDWLRQKPGFESASSCLTDPAIRRLHISFLNRLIDATAPFGAVKGYNILNEPVAASEYSVQKHPEEFQTRWEGVLEICEAVRRHMNEAGVKQFLTFGNAGGEAAYAEYNWVNTGKYDLIRLWTQTLDKVAAQGVTALQESDRWHANRPKIRTEGFLNFAILGAARDTEDFVSTKIKWSQGADHVAAWYDYDNVYDYEGLANASVKNLEAFYPWRIGDPNGSSDDLRLLDHRHGDRPTPYYWALRDLASGVDSFETLDRSALPKNGEETKAFDPVPAKAGLSRRWSGTGAIVGEKEETPPQTDSTVAARIALEPGQSVVRSVVSAHWRDSGVSAADSFVFWAKAEAGGELVLTIDTGRQQARRPVSIPAGAWTRCRVPLRELGLTDSDIGLIQSVGFVNERPTTQRMLIDEFLIRRD